jgi:hypothetical protein
MDSVRQRTETNYSMNFILQELYVCDGPQKLRAPVRIQNWNPLKSL